ncbi:MAG: AAA family ATPase [Candidatus Acidiferrales bacterium]
MAQNIAIVTGSKGGVGTTTVAVNLGVQLAGQSRKRVGLLDLARPFGQISMMLDLEPRFTILDALERIERLDASALASLAMKHKAGIEILAGPLHAPMKPDQRQSVTLSALTRLVEISSRAFDWVVIDMGVVNAAEWAPVLCAAGTILLVAEPSALALGMIHRHIAVAGAAGVNCERISIVANRWRQNDGEALANFERMYNQKVLKRLPNDYRQVTEAVALGTPLVGSSSNALLSRYRELASWLLSRADGSAEPAQPLAKTKYWSTPAT